MTVILLVANLGVWAQKGGGYSSVNRIMYRIPDSLTFSSAGMAGYVNSHFRDQKQKAWAIFSWIASHIRYEPDSISTNNYYQKPSEVSDKILRSRTGVCLQFAYLFCDLTSRAGIKSYVVQGYTKQHGMVDWLPHVWCAGYIDTAWYLFDPTWGAGFYVNRGFVKQVSNYYFMRKPEELIASHMPFDPLWQFSSYPVTNDEFYGRNLRVNRNKPYFNYLDTLAQYEKESELEQYISSARRIEGNGVSNAFVATKLRILRGEIDYYRKKAMAEKYKVAVDYYNEGIKQLNEFIHHSNNRFHPERDTLEMRHMLDSAERVFCVSAKTLAEITDPEASVAVSMKLLNESLSTTMEVLNIQKAALDRYLNFSRENE